MTNASTILSFSSKPDSIQIGESPDEPRQITELKSDLYAYVKELIDKDSTVIASREYILALTELLFLQTQMYAIDLEAFAKHGKRSNVSIEDLKLLFRRNPDMIPVLTRMHENIKCAPGK